MEKVRLKILSTLRERREEGIRAKSKSGAFPNSQISKFGGKDTMVSGAYLVFIIMIKKKHLMNAYLTCDINCSSQREWGKLSKKIVAKQNFNFKYII